MNQNRRGAAWLPALLVFAWLLAACAAPAPAADDSGLQIALDYARDAERMTVRVADSSGNPVTGALVSVEGNMNHAGMVPVTTEGVRDEDDGTADGRYTLPFGFTMLGDWILTVRVEQEDGTVITRDIGAQVTGEAVTIEGSPEASSPSGELEVANLRARPAPLAGGNGAIYFTVINGTDAEEQLLAASSPAAEAVELHETVDDNGVMRMMHQPEGFVIPPGGTLELMPGGKHVMLIGLAEPLDVGDTVDLTLTFAQAGDQVFNVPVMEIEGTGQMPAMPHGAEGDPEHDPEAAEDHAEGHEAQHGSEHDTEHDTEHEETHTH